MGFINKDTLAVDAILTKKGIDYLRTAVFGENRAEEHVITKFALSDDEIDYGLWDETPSGSNFVKPYGQVIDNQPLTEPMITDNETMRYFLFKDVEISQTYIPSIYCVIIIIIFKKNIIFKFIKYL